MMMLVDGGGGGGGACSFTLDVQWILDAIDKVKNFVRKIENAMRNVANKAARFVEKLSGIAGLFCWVPGVGKFLKKAIRQAAEIIDQAIQIVSRGLQAQLEIMKHLLAPWEVRSAGKSIADELAPKCDEFALQYQKGHFKSVETWTGAASEAFFKAIDKQQEAAESTAEGAKKFGDAVHQMGAKGVEITVNFITQYITAAVGIIQAALTMAAIPVGTAIGAAEIIALIGAILTYIMVWVNAMLGMITSMVEMENAAHQAVPGGQWPKAVV